LKDWAKTYRFHRNHAKVVYYQFFTKNSFIAFSLVAARSSIPALHRGSEKVVAGAYTRRLLNLFYKYSNTRIRFLYAFKYSRPLLMSFYITRNKIISSTDELSDLATSNAYIPLLYDRFATATH
jgi:hypothetical protein